jgi:hypothetical protein
LQNFNLDFPSFLFNFFFVWRWNRKQF